MGYVILSVAWLLCGLLPLYYHLTSSFLRVKAMNFVLLCFEMVFYAFFLQVAFHKDVMTRSVTLEGDVFEPRGLLTGGSRK